MKITKTIYDTPLSSSDINVLSKIKRRIIKHACMLVPAFSVLGYFIYQDWVINETTNEYALLLWRIVIFTAIFSFIGIHITLSIHNLFSNISLRLSRFGYWFFGLMSALNDIEQQDCIRIKTMSDDYDEIAEYISNVNGMGRKLLKCELIMLEDHYRTREARQACKEIALL